MPEKQKKGKPKMMMKNMFGAGENPQKAFMPVPSCGDD